MGGRRSCKVYTERFVFFFFSTRYTVDAVTNIFGSGSRRNAKYAYYARTKSFLGENTNFGPEQISRRDPAPFPGERAPLERFVTTHEIRSTSAVVVFFFFFFFSLAAATNDCFDGDDDAIRTCGDARIQISCVQSGLKKKKNSNYRRLYGRTFFISTSRPEATSRPHPLLLSRRFRDGFS